MGIFCVCLSVWLLSERTLCCALLVWLLGFVCFFFSLFLSLRSYGASQVWLCASLERSVIIMLHVCMLCTPYNISYIIYVHRERFCVCVWIFEHRASRRAHARRFERSGIAAASQSTQRSVLRVFSTTSEAYLAWDLFSLLAGGTTPLSNSIVQHCACVFMRSRTQFRTLKLVNLFTYQYIAISAFDSD